MRLSSLLIIALLATTGCRTTLQGSAAYPGAPVESAAESSGEGPTDAAPSEPAPAEDEANPEDEAKAGEAPSDAPAPKSAEAASSDERRRLLAGIPLSAMGLASAGMGGFLVGWSLGTCDPGETGCPSRVALPIVGMLCLAAGAIPMAFGVSLWAPAVVKTGQASPWPEVTASPTAASVKWRF
jgi:hypothetical protein